MAAVLTPEQQLMLATSMATNAGGRRGADGRRRGSMNFPGVRQSWQDDEKTQLANSLLEQGGSVAPVAAGGWAWLDGLSRLGAGAMGGKWAKEQREGYEDVAQQRAADFEERYKRAMAGAGAQPGAVDQTPQIQPSALLNNPIPGSSPGVTVTPPAPQQGAVQSPTLSGNPTRPPASGAISGVVAPQAVTSPRVLQPGESARAQRRAQSRASFNDAYAFTRQAEGGYNSRDPRTGKPVNFGIDQRANPDVDVKNLTADGARQIMYDKYWVPSGAASLPPDLAKVHFDTYVLNPSQAKKILAASGGDVGTYLGMRREFLTSLGGPTQRGWANRDAALARSVGLDPNALGSGAGGAGDTGGGEGPVGRPQVAIPDMPSMPTRPTEPEIDPIRESPRRKLAEALMGGGDAMFPLMQSYLDAGMQEEADLNKQREENVAQMRSLGYQTDLQTYGRMTGDNYQHQLDTRLKAIEQQYGYESDEFQAALEDHYAARKEARQARVEQQAATDAYNREWALQERRLNAAKATDQEKRQARMDAWVATAAGGNAMKAGREGSKAASDMLGYINQFDAAYNQLTQGGLQNLGPISRLVGAVTGNEYYGAAKNASNGMARILGEQLKGSMSDSDRQWLIEAVPNLGNSASSNKGILTAMRRAAERETEYWGKYNEAIASNGPQGLAEFQDKWGKYIAQVSLNDKVSKNYITFDEWNNRKVVR